MKRCLSGLLLCCVAMVCVADDTAYGKLFIGTIDVSRDNEDSQYGIEYQFAEGISRYDFKPFIGLLRTRHSSHYLYTGLSRTSKFTESATGLAVTFSFGPGLYAHGNGEDTDLGHVFELRTSGGLMWIFPDGTRIGAHYAHLSNASIASENPGTEMLTIGYELPF